MVEQSKSLEKFIGRYDLLSEFIRNAAIEVPTLQIDKLQVKAAELYLPVRDFTASMTVLRFYFSFDDLEPYNALALNMKQISEDLQDFIEDRLRGIANTERSDYYQRKIFSALTKNEVYLNDAAAIYKSKFYGSRWI